MKLLLMSCMTFFVVSVSQWESDIITARNKSRESHRPLLLNFSGSDWCIPCIRMHKDVFESESFVSLSDSLLVLYNADFPRKKKNELPAWQRRQNDSIAALYNPEGKFPFTVLLSPDGKVLREWDGYPEKGVQPLLAEIKKAVYAWSH